MWPFKHEVDDGLECMYTLLDTCVDRLEIFDFLSHVQDGLKEHYDIKMITYLMVGMTKSLLKATVTRYLRDWLLHNFFPFHPLFS